LFRRLGSGLTNGIYSTTTWFLSVVLKVLFRYRILGRENVKPDGDYIIVARHRSYWDVAFMAVALGARNRVHFISRRGLMRGVPIVRWAIRAYSTIIDRENFGKSDFRRVREACKRERLIGLFPEGTTKRRVDAKAGAVRFAEIANKEILPLNIRAAGPYPPAYPFRFPKVTVSIGPAFEVTDLDGEESADVGRTERHRRMSERLMQRVDTA